jgi:hypothetical protein
MLVRLDVGARLHEVDHALDEIVSLAVDRQEHASPGTEARLGKAFLEKGRREFKDGPRGIRHRKFHPYGSVGSAFRASRIFFALPAEK